MTKIKLLLAAASGLALTACTTTMQDAEPASASAQAVPNAHDQLFALFERSDAQELELSPINAMFRGDYSHADRIGDFYSDELDARARALLEQNMADLVAIDRSALSATDQLAYDVFKLQLEQGLSDYSPEIMALTQARPINHMSGFHTFYPAFESGKSAAPFKTVADYDNAVSRNADYVKIVDRAIGRFRQGMGTGVLETSLTINNVIGQLDAQLELDVEASPFWGPIDAFPAEFSDADKARITADYRRSLGQVYAANRRLRDFLKNEYLPVARSSTGLSQMKGGAVLYEKLIHDTTTLPLTADYLHNLGLSEVARIKGELVKVQREVGFAGTLNEFFDYVRTDPKFQPKSREALTQAYYDIGKQVDEQIGDYFSLLPKTPLEIRPYEEFREKYEAGGAYESGAPDGSRPGTFYFNSYDLPSRLTTGNVTLYLHEGAPGHHFQISLAQENEDLPAFMRFGGTTAFLEGWALYAETLGYPMGFYKDPWNRYGTLQDEQLRAMRLVVDTGLHAKQWSREQAIDYMLENSGMTRTEVVAEVERYIAIPSQALGYKVGALKIQELRDRAQAALGDRFDIKQFHAQVLGTGALPLAVLEQKIDRWIAASKGD